MSQAPAEERTPQKLVYEAHKNAAKERERVNAAPYVPDDVINTQLAEVEYHAAIMEYFSRLKPHLPDRPEYWNDVALWNEPLQGRRAQIAESLARYYGIETYEVHSLLDALETSENWPDITERGDQTVRGLKNLVHWRSRTETEQQTRTDVIEGEVSETIVRPMHLPRDVAMRAHDALDEVAAELGYNTRPGKDITKSRLDAESGDYGVEGVTSDK